MTKNLNFDNNQIRTRFAPSPTGYLHIGGLRTALYAYLFSKQQNGKFILRLEDTDQNRLVKGADTIIYSNLKDAGLHYDEGPDVGGDFGPYVQSKRKEIYIKYANELVKKGGAYYCFCTKERIEKLHQDGLNKYDKHCLNLTKTQVDKMLDQGTSFVIRQNMPLSGITKYDDMVFGEIEIENKELEDNVLIKGDGLPTYNFANVVDDYLMGITHCIRGVEYLSSTPKYNHIYDCMGWQRPHYIHLQPIMKDGQNKLSKRDGAASYDDFKAKGFLPIAIINYIALLGWSPKDENEKFDLNGLLSRFNLSGLSKSPSIFDEVKMRYINSLHIKDLTLEQYHAHAIPFYDKLDYLKNFDFYDEEGLKYLSNLLCSRTEIFSDITHLTAFLTEFENFDLDLFVNDKWKTCKKMAKQMLDQIAKKINSNEFDVLDSDSVDRFCAEFGYKKGQVLWIFRIAVTGAKNTPGGAGEMARLLGKNQIISRIKSTLNRLY